MTILFRYVAREIIASYLIVLVGVISIYLAVDFIEKIDNFLEAGVPAMRCLVYLLYKLPFIAVQIAPVAFLLSILIALGLMSKNNEVIALRSCGIGKMHLLKPGLVIGLCICGGLFLISEMVVPQFMVNANRIWLREVRKKDIVTSQTHDIWMRVARQIIHIKRYDPLKKQIFGITLFSFNDRFQLTERIDARSGGFVDGRWQLKNGIRQIFTDDGGVQQSVFDGIEADEIDLNPDDLARAVKPSDEMGLAELQAYIQKVEREGYGATRYRVDYHSKLAAPFVCLFLSVLGVAIALRGKLREGLSVSIVFGLGIAFLYWIFNSFCLSLGYAEMMPPVISAWMANLLFSCAAGVLLLRND